MANNNDTMLPCSQSQMTGDFDPLNFVQQVFPGMVILTNDMTMVIHQTYLENTWYCSIGRFLLVEKSGGFSPKKYLLFRSVCIQASQVGWLVGFLSPIIEVPKNKARSSSYKATSGGFDGEYIFNWM